MQANKKIMYNCKNQFFSCVSALQYFPRHQSHQVKMKMVHSRTQKSSWHHNKRNSVHPSVLQKETRDREGGLLSLSLQSATVLLQKSPLPTHLQTEQILTKKEGLLSLASEHHSVVIKDPPPPSSDTTGPDQRWRVFCNNTVVI